MDIDKIEELIHVLEGSPNEELCVQKGDYRVHIKKGAAQPPMPTKKAAMPAAPSVQTIVGPKDKFINSPMVGIFHTVDGIAQVGATVSEGQAVGSIESMKLSNDITSNVSGTVVEVLVEDGMPVEYGQPLFRIEA